MAKKTSKTVEEKLSPTPAEPATYTTDEALYLGHLRQRMATARDLRENKHDEFDGMTYLQRCEWNRKGANTFIAPKKNKGDTTFVTGVTRNRMVQLHSYVSNLNLTPTVQAWDAHALKDTEMALGQEDIIAKTYYDEGDDEKLVQRQWQLLEQGEVFLEEIWLEETATIKNVITAFDGKNIKDAKWVVAKKKKDGKPVHNILQNENVFLGDITVFGIERQPFIFTVQQVPYDVAEAEYGDWARWSAVPHDVNYFSTAAEPVGTAYNNNWSLTQLKKDHVEILKYQDPWSNEYAIIINGNLMTPVGLPLPWNWGEEPRYNITMQTLGMISPFFAYGKSIPMLTRTKQLLMDEFWRLMILKTQKSFIPAYANNTGVQLSNRIFMPGQITSGIDADRIKRLDPDGATGVSRAELAVIQQLQTSLDDDTTPQGMSPKSPGAGNRTTATQHRDMASKAELMLTLIVFSMSTLERKLGEARLYNNLENWFKPVGEESVKLDDTRNELVKRYRSMNIDKHVENEGPGQSIVRVGKTADPLSIYREEEKIKQNTGVPTRIRYIDPDVVSGGKHIFKVVVEQKEKKTSDIGKVLFNEMMDGVTKFFPAGGEVTPNLKYLSEQYAMTWRMDPMKMFKSAQGQPGAEQGGGAPTPVLPPPGDNSGGAGQGARGKLTPKSMTQAGKPPVAPTPTLAQ